MNTINKIDIIIPCFNEELRIFLTLQEITKFFKNKKLKYEVIIVNDGSTDKTVDVSNNFDNIKILSNSKNFWKWFSVKKWVLKSDSDWCLVMDADSSTPISELDKLILYKEYDIVIWSRYLHKNWTYNSYSLFRKFISIFWNKYISKFFIKWISDTQCWFKLFKTSVAKTLFEWLFTNWFWFDLEILLKAQNLWYKIKEIDIDWKASKWSKFNPFIDPIKTLFEFIIIKSKFWW